MNHRQRLCFLARHLKTLSNGVGRSRWARLRQNVHSCIRGRDRWPRRQRQTPITARAKLIDGYAHTSVCTASRPARPPYTRCTTRATTSTVPCASAHRAPMRKLIGPTKPRQGALGPGAEPEHHAPEHRAGIDFAPAPHRPAFTGQTLDLRLRQQAGQRLANTNKLDSGHGHSPDRLKLRNSNLIRGRGPLQPLVSWSITSLSEHQCGDWSFCFTNC